jgi:hypothetical protein
LDRLIPGRDWRSKIQAIDQQEQIEREKEIRAAGARKSVLVEEFRAALREVGQYRFVAELEVLRPTKDRTLYFLVYGTRRAEGIEVFRDCQVKSLEGQSAMRGRTKLEEREKQSGQMELLASANEIGPDRSMVSLPNEAQRARQMLHDLVFPPGPDVRWGEIWPEVLSRCVIRLMDLKRIANEDRKAGILEFPDWPDGAKRTPENHYLVRRGNKI